MPMTFDKWIDTFIDEKGIDRETMLEVEGPSGMNFIPVQCIVDMMKIAPEREQRVIKDTIVKIDFLNRDVLHYFKFLAKAVAM